MDIQQAEGKKQLSLLGDIMIRPWLCRLIRDGGKHVSISTRSNVEKYQPHISRPGEDYTTAIKIIFSNFTNCATKSTSSDANLIFDTNLRFDHISVSFDGTVIASVEIPSREIPPRAIDKQSIEIPLSSISGHILIRTNDVVLVEFVVDSTELTEICLLSEGITDVVVP
jgi:hypothetical protein